MSVPMETSASNNERYRIPTNRSAKSCLASRMINGRDFVPARKRSQEHFSTHSTTRKRNLQRICMEKFHE